MWGCSLCPEQINTMSTIVRKYSTSLLAVGVYVAILGFALACSFGLL